MSTQELMQIISKWIANNIVIIIVFLSLFFEVSKIKINPISTLLKLLYKPIDEKIIETKEEVNNKIKANETEVNTEINNISEYITKIDESLSMIGEKIAKNEMLSIRWNILNMASGIENNQKYSREQYNQIFNDFNIYIKLIDEFGFQNNVVDNAINEINNHYNIWKNGPYNYF